MGPLARTHTHKSNQPIGQKRIYFIQRTLFTFLASFLLSFLTSHGIGGYVCTSFTLGLLSSFSLNGRRAMVTDVSRFNRCQLRA